MRDMQPVPARVLVGRGILHRCPRCGGRGVFESWFKLKDRCPTCGYKFVRESGFWLGAYVINFGVGEGLIGVLLFTFAVVASNNEDLNPVPWLVAGMVLGVLAPVALFPLSRTVWAGVDLAMHPLEPAEEADALLHAEGQRPPQAV